MLYFVRTHNLEEDNDDFWIALADDIPQLRKMFDDEYTRFISATTDVTDELINQYGGLALLTTP